MNYSDSAIRKVLLSTNMKAEQCEQMLRVTRGNADDAIRIFKSSKPTEAMIEYTRERKEREAREAEESEFESRRIEISLVINAAAEAAGYKHDSNFEHFLSILLAKLIH